MNERLKEELCTCTKELESLRLVSEFEKEIEELNATVVKKNKTIKLRRSSFRDQNQNLQGLE